MCCSAVADFALALLLGVARKLVPAHEYARSPAYTRYAHQVLLGAPVAGTTLGIVGMGRIGLEVARRGAGFRMRVLDHNRSRRAAAEREVGAEYASLDALLERSDHVVSMK